MIGAQLRLWHWFSLFDGHLVPSTSALRIRPHQPHPILQSFRESNDDEPHAIANANELQHADDVDDGHADDDGDHDLRHDG